ncbi:MAG: hypothetical protein IKE58_04230 [Blautia sp.]|nr:hypothetical protein [Blautia sp.]
MIINESCNDAVLLHRPKAVGKHFLADSIQWHITDECDQRGKHCYVFSGDPCRKPGSMTWKQILNKKNLAPVCGQVYNFERIREAVAAQDEGKVNGKIVVKV